MPKIKELSMEEIHVLIRELNLLKFYNDNWDNPELVKPWERLYFYKKITELALQHANEIDPDLTKRVISAIHRMSITR
jgi:hypothetical protein